MKDSDPETIVTVKKFYAFWSQAMWLASWLWAVKTKIKTKAYVFSIDENRSVCPVSQCNVQHCPVFSEIDLLARKHGISKSLDSTWLRLKYVHLIKNMCHVPMHFTRIIHSDVNKFW